MASLVVAGMAACGASTSDDDGIATALEALQRLGIEASAIPEEQRSFFADDVISFDEYRDAIEAQWTCLDNSGLFSVGPIEYGYDGSLGFNAIYDGGDGPGVEDTVIDSIYQDCTLRFGQVTSMVWSLMRVPSVEERSQLRPQVISCVNDAGLDISPDATDALVFEAVNNAFPLPGDEPEIGIDLEAIRACAEDFSRYFLVFPPE